MSLLPKAAKDVVSLSMRTDERRQLGPQQRQLVGHEPSPYDLAFGRAPSPRRATLALRA